MSSPPTRPRRPGKERPLSPDAANPPTMPDAEFPASDWADTRAPEPMTSSGVTIRVEASGQGAVREGVEAAASRGGERGLMGPLRKAPHELLERIERTIEAELAARTPEEETALDRALRDIGADYAKGSSLGQEPPGSDPSAGERNTPGAGRVAVLTEAEVRRNHARSAAAADNARLAGGSISPETREIVDAYDRGEIDADEMVRQVIAWHARPPKA